MNEKVTENTGKKKKAPALQKSANAARDGAKRVVGAMMSLKKAKNSDDSNDTKSDDETLKAKKSSKIGAIFYTIKEGIKHSAKFTADFSKRTYGQCYGFLKNKGLIDKAKKNKSLTFSFLGFLVMIIITLFILALSGHHQKTGPNPVSNLMKINSIQAELSNVQDTVTTTSQMNEQERQALANKLQEIDVKLNEVSDHSGAAQSSQIKDLQTTLQSNKVNLSQKITALNKEINRIKAEVFPAPTLSAKALPFKVVSVDPWNGEPYAEVVQRSNSTMIAYVGLYQMTGGWKVIDINAPEQTVTFINAQGQVVHVQVKQF